MSSRGALSVLLAHGPSRAVRVGTLLTDPTTTRFIVDEAYLLMGAARPTLSASLWDPHSEERTLSRLMRDQGKVRHAGYLPPFLAGLLPEGKLRRTIEAQMGLGPRDEVVLLERLGGDLPGAVVVTALDGRMPVLTSATAVPASPPDTLPRLKFSLAGVQAKFSMLRKDERLVLPASGMGGRWIVKLAAEDWPRLCELEHLGLTLARAAGVEVADAELFPIDRVDGVPHQLLIGPTVLAVKRFDRTDDGGRVHMEDFASILEQVPDGKYGSNVETVMKVISRFSSRGAEDVLEAVRRVVVDTLLGNGDAHLKNWSFIYPDERRPQLSPAYDIVPTVLYIPGDDLALKLGGTKSFARVSRTKLARIARHANVSEASLTAEVRATIERALDTWPAIVRDAPITEGHRAGLRVHAASLKLTRHLPSPFTTGPAVLVAGGTEIAWIDDVRPAPARRDGVERLRFTVPGTLSVDVAQLYHLRMADGRVTSLRIASLKPTAAKRTAVIAIPEAEHPSAAGEDVP